ncbi:hypothetical protein B0T20DRAFT_166117 [Sordaria brevicollis]|uniref:Uncharacterized protein n=1 Tax=Sordaria brevicollis TaxID=83679 RepID=A0AAE0PGU9_SORBR|nr:hypothetical protein B0T20DRAFT_166117 [Sordaria brevicollis]
MFSHALLSLTLFLATTTISSVHASPALIPSTNTNTETGPHRPPTPSSREPPLDPELPFPPPAFNLTTTPLPFNSSSSASNNTSTNGLEKREYNHGTVGMYEGTKCTGGEKEVYSVRDTHLRCFAVTGKPKNSLVVTGK